MYNDTESIELYVLLSDTMASLRSDTVEERFCSVPW